MRHWITQGSGMEYTRDCGGECSKCYTGTNKGLVWGTHITGEANAACNTLGWSRGVAWSTHVTGDVNAASIALD